MFELTAIIIATSVWALPSKKGIETLPGYDFRAESTQARAEPAPKPVPAADIVAEFMKRLSDTDAYDQEARSFARKAYRKAERGALGGFIESVLPVLSPEFRRALDLLDEDQTAQAADAFEAVSRADDPFLAVTAAGLGATTMIELEQVDRCQEMLDRVRAHHEPIERYTTASDHFRFMLGYCQLHNLEYAEARATLQDFLRNHPDAPERLRVSATQILTELSRRRPKQLGDIRDLMEYARRRIANDNTDRDVRLRQDEAVALLDALIEEAEDQENQGGGEGGGNSGSNPGAQNPKSGARRSMAPSGPDRMGELRKTRARPGEMWGKMPPKEREQILQTLQKRFPSQYRELLEQYYKQLAKDAPAQ